MYAPITADELTTWRRSSGRSLREYRSREFKRSVTGQVCRGAFFSVYYPALALYKLLMLVLQVAKFIAIAILLAAQWALWPKSDNAIQLLATLVPLTAVISVVHA